VPVLQLKRTREVSDDLSIPPRIAKFRASILAGDGIVYCRPGCGEGVGHKMSNAKLSPEFVQEILDELYRDEEVYKVLDSSGAPLLRNGRQVYGAMKNATQVERDYWKMAMDNLMN
jgi:hypothetical protein